MRKEETHMRRPALFTVVGVLVVIWLLGLILDFWWPEINAVLAIALVVLLYTMFSSRETVE
jgi:hypothetical protein